MLLAGLVLITVPLHWWGLSHPWQTGATTSTPRTAPDAPRQRVRSVARSTPFLLLAVANALTALAVFAVVINLVPMLVEQGMSRNLAAVALGLGGVGQVTGRLGYARFAAATSVTVAHRHRHRRRRGRDRRARPCPGLDGAAHRARHAAGPGPRHLHAHPGHRHHRPVGTRAYGTLNGILTAPALVAAASASFVGAALAQLLGSYSAAFLVLAGPRGRRSRARPWRFPATGADVDPG